MAHRGSSGRPRRGPRGRGGDGGRGGRRVVLAGQGAGWSLWVPEDLYRAMSEEERADLVRRQAALLDGAAPTSTERRPRPAGPVTGAPDQLALFRG